MALSKNAIAAAFREILLENEQTEQEAPLAGLLTRNKQIPIIKNKATVLIGVRRSGKSTLLRQIEAEFKKQSQGPHLSLSIHFFDERLAGLKAEDLNLCLEVFYELHPTASRTTPLHLYCDEIEVVENWELFVDRQLRNPNRRVFLTGSSSRLLSTEIASMMRGRSLAFEVFPFSFEEILDWEGYSKSAIRIDQSRIKARFRKYLFEGGFPEVIHQAPNIQRKILNEYYEVLLLRDLIERNQETNVLLLRAFIRILLSSFASLVTINKCHDRLKSMGIKTDKSKLSEILKWAEDCYLLFSVSLFTESVTKQMVNPKKIYAIDPGFIKNVTTQISENVGRLLENVIYIHLRRQTREIYYYRTRSGYEIDFIVEGKQLYQVAAHIQDSATRNREIRALEEGMSEIGVRQSVLIVSEADPLDQEGIQTSAGTIRVIEAHQFCQTQSLEGDDGNELS
jgi:predicted AAA+ superfamily ATPase